MKKDFTFGNFVVYALRYWLVTVIFAVVGLGSGILYGILTDDTEYIEYRGGIGIGGIGVFANDLLDYQTDNPSSVYSEIKSGAFNEMSSEFLSRQVYNDLENEWRELKYNKKLTKAKAREKFFESFSVWVSGDYLYVRFKQEKNDDSQMQNAFSEKAVNAYINAAFDRAVAHEPMFAKGDNVENRLRKIAAEQTISTDDQDTGLLGSAIVGALIGVVVGLLIMLVVYMTDRRINSYGDIAQLTGEKLYDVSRGSVTNKVCPRIDCDMDGARTLLVAGSESTSKRLAVLYGEYAHAAGYKTLRIDFTRSDSGKAEDTFGEFMSGKPVSGCVSDSFGVDVLSGGQSWATVLRNSDKICELTAGYGRVVICAPYREDGSLGVLSKISDRVVYAIDHSAMRTADVLGAALEMQSPQKNIGAVIEKAGRCFVGSDKYVRYTEEEE